jgi:hypothetical protein
MNQKPPKSGIPDESDDRAFGITSIRGRHITRPATGSELSKIFTGAPKPLGSFCKPQRYQLPSRLFLRKVAALLGLPTVNDEGS